MACAICKLCILPLVTFTYVCKQIITINNVQRELVYLSETIALNFSGDDSPYRMPYRVRQQNSHAHTYYTLPIKLAIQWLVFIENKYDEHENDTAHIIESRNLVTLRYIDGYTATTHFSIVYICW